MKETQKNYDDLQNKWRDCIRTTCTVMRVTEHIKDLFQRIKEWIEDLIEKFRQAFSPFVDSVNEAFSVLEDLGVANSTPKTYPQYPQVNVNNFKINTKGFHLPPVRCARSRC